MRRTLLHSVSVVALVAAALIAVDVPAEASTPTAYARSVAQICAHARLFEEAHEIGTRAGAIALADDIRSSGQRRLARVAVLSPPLAQRRLVSRWIALERHLTEVYALNYVRVYDLIAEPRTTSGQRREAVDRLTQLMHAPDRLRRAAARLAQRLQFPECTGA